ncbi:hypothetical protein F511_37231 [Dorcoceras hygrometricum]|uniref:Uncharacterized protein n=1 Tax=Dorcoceras hygrometricum TaxID=472368 RepID=A0A2Z7D5G7_9LAMI|nr:hypothetical protein F511_37231 [Dorcoceras hygrometricum]
MNRDGPHNTTRLRPSKLVSPKRHRFATRSRYPASITQNSLQKHLIRIQPPISNLSTTLTAQTRSQLKDLLNILRHEGCIYEEPPEGPCCDKGNVVFLQDTSTKSVHSVHMDGKPLTHFRCDTLITKHHPRCLSSGPQHLQRRKGKLLHQWVKVISLAFQKSILLRPHTSSNERSIGDKGREMSRTHSHLQAAQKLSDEATARISAFAREASHHQRCAISLNWNVTKLSLISSSSCTLSNKPTMCSRHPSAARPHSAPVKVGGSSTGTQPELAPRHPLFDSQAPPQLLTISQKDAKELSVEQHRPYYSKSGPDYNLSNSYTATTTLRQLRGIQN